MNHTSVLAELQSVWPSIPWAAKNDGLTITGRAPARYLRGLAKYARAQDWRLGTVVAKDDGSTVDVRYCFYATRHPGWLHIVVDVDPTERNLPSLTPVLIAADWQEREIEDLFSIHFASHPRLGDFVLHNDTWAEDIGLMRPRTAASARVEARHRFWQPLRVLQEDGAFVMPVGPIFSGHAESALFLLETVGEDVVRAIPRLFYKYRAIEKIAEGRSAADTLLLAERCAGTSAIGNGWAYCRAVELAAGMEVPARAQVLRGFFAELERVRHHMSSVREICVSTGLTVAASQSLLLEERLLRTSGEIAGHRYLFGLLALGGLSRDFEHLVLQRALDAAVGVLEGIRQLGEALADSSSFLDRIENVGIIGADAARTFELVGPLARASGVVADLRRVQPYGPYAATPFGVPSENEGDGYARLRVLLAEIEQSVEIMRQLLCDMPLGPVRNSFVPRSGSALGWTEAPRGASVHWIDLDEMGNVARYRLTPPSFRNWHGFHTATEGFAFQDFPIVLATLDLSVAESDR